MSCKYRYKCGENKIPAEQPTPNPISCWGHKIHRFDVSWVFPIDSIRFDSILDCR